jgi:hypothetical protein
VPLIALMFRHFRRLLLITAAFVIFAFSLPRHLFSLLFADCCHYFH